MTIANKSGTFTAGGQASGGLAMVGKYNVTLKGDGTANLAVRVERSFDNGSNWFTLSKNTDGAAAVYSLTANQKVSLVLEEPEAGVLVQLAVDSYTAGNADYRISR